MIKKIMKKREGKVAERFVSKKGAYVIITGLRQSELDAAVKQIISTASHFPCTNL
jgi:hypothetical protein